MGRGDSCATTSRGSYKENKSQFRGRKNAVLCSVYLLNTRLEVQQGL